ncbi:MAG: hypothetical protein E7322_05745 [Clostridiales bacterium]|nr:hypothetical protein [Clostridiales bacterium]
MTQQEVNQLLLLMKANYAYAFKGMSQEEKYLLLNTWTLTLEDIDANIVMIAVMKLISKSKWMPTVAEIREACSNIYYDAVFELEQLKFISSWDPNSQKNLKQREDLRKLIGATEHLRKFDGAEIPLMRLIERPVIAGNNSREGTFSMLSEAEYAYQAEREDRG